MRTKRRLNNADLRRGGVEPGKCAPVIDDQAGANNVGTSIDGTGLVANHPSAMRSHGEREDRPLEEPVIDWKARPGPGRKFLDGRAHPGS